MEQEHQPEFSDELMALNKIGVASVVIEQACLQIVDGTRNNLKQRVNSVIKAAKFVQSYYINNVGTDKFHREQYKREFLKSEIVLYGEIFGLIYGLEEEDLEHIVEQLKKIIIP